MRFYRVIDLVTGLARRRLILFDLVATLALSSVLTLVLFWPSRRSLASPIGGTDALASYATGFMGWTSTQFGYPFGMTAFPYFPSTDLTQRSMASAFLVATSDRILSVNLVLVLSFPLTALAAWWVFHLSGAPRPLSIALAGSFSFLPYHIFRGMGHIYLSAMWSTALAVGLALLMGRGDVRRVLDHQRTGGRFRWLAIVVCCLVVAWSGIYYAFFACLLMIVALAWLLAHGAPRKTLLQSAIPLALVFGAVAVVLLVAAVANWLDPPLATVAPRQPSESAIYAGNLAFALTPSPLTDVPFVGSFTARFRPYVHPELEGFTYGQFGTVVSSFSAMVLLLGLTALTRRKYHGGIPVPSSVNPQAPGLHVALLATCLLFFVPWSTNFSFALAVSPGLRSWDRLLPVILLLLMSGAVSTVADLAKQRGRWRRAAAIMIVAITVLDGITPYAGMVSFRLRAGEERARQATEYAVRVNDVAAGQCGVLQLPYVPFPEKATELADMADYEHFLVALTNPEKQWSYGGVKYTTASRWASRLSDELTPSSVASLAEVGFCGVHLDRMGYSRPRAVALSASLERLLGPPAAEGHGGRWQFFALPSKGQRTRDVRDRTTLTPGAERLFYPATEVP